jgi:integrase
LAEGVPLPAVSARLGHSSVRTTQEIYAHMITGQDEEAARKWEEYQKRNRPAALRAQLGTLVKFSTVRYI